MKLHLKQTTPQIIFWLLLLLPGKDLYALSHHHQNYPEFVRNIQNLIGRGSAKVWLATRMLSDSAISTSLYLSRYRGAQVAVLLSQKFKTHYLSQWAVLRKNNIPVVTVDDGFFKNWSSMIIVDGAVWTSEIPLVRYYKSRTYELVKEDQSKTTLVMRHFKKRFFAKSIHQLKKGKKIILPKNRDVDEWNGFQGYQYSRKWEKKPRGLPGRLPRMTKWKKEGRKSH